MEWLNVRFVVSCAIALLMSIRAYKRKSLSLSGSIAALFTGFTTSFTGGYKNMIVLLAFFISSSKLTKLSTKHEGNRDYKQVFANSLPATIYCMIIYYLTNFQAINIPFLSNSNTNININTNIMNTINFLNGAFLAYYCSAAGDTWSSEVGSLSKDNDKPILITKLICQCKKYKVPKGTNGGVTLLGTMASIAAGLFIGVIYFICNLIFICVYSMNNVNINSNINSDIDSDVKIVMSTVYGFGVLSMIDIIKGQIVCVLISVFCGFLGSFIDSIIGATMEYSGYDSKLDKIVNIRPLKSSNGNVRKVDGTGMDLIGNDTVNFVSNFVTSLIGGWLIMTIYMF